ncbi:MAG TPA: hypothetical protein VHT51_20840 [Micropepsaceae bacterium]|jgi:hypothetical protein|nr:hypothetical protein [Micropepsaceae bacterium]
MLGSMYPVKNNNLSLPRGEHVPRDTDWELVTVLFPRRSCVSLTLIEGLVLRRRHRGKWQYREVTDATAEEHEKYFKQKSKLPWRRKRQSNGDSR